ncbi:MAG TPA: tail fiber domain-containing protein [Verrucomicrobiae bacterium]|nr:tail fiber domain-containing protein [Verrucomicrobiae bacterium]
MNTKLASVLLLAAACTGTVVAQTTTFTYQGRLQSDGAAFSGPAEFRFTLWDAAEGGTQLAVTTPETIAGTVSDGLFTLPLDFGAELFAAGADRWLQIALRTGLGEFLVLTPRQRVVPTPYAISAGRVSGSIEAGQLSGVLPAALLSGTFDESLVLNNPANSFTGEGAGLTALNASQLGSGTVPDERLSPEIARLHQVWRLGGNDGTMPGTHFLGTRDGQPLEFKVNGARALRLEFRTDHLDVGSPSPNIISGHADNEVAPGVSGATIAGGGGTNWWGPTSPQRVSGEFSTIGGGIGNIVEAAVGVIAGGERGFIGSNAFNAFIGGGAWNTNLSGDATIGGGRFNSILGNANNAYIGGGANNTVSNIQATVGGGSVNLAGGANATVAGGYINAARGDYATVGGGFENVASGSYSTVPGGSQNTAAQNHTLAAGHRAKANHQGAFVWADSQNADFASTAVNQFAVRAAGGIRLSGNVQLADDYRQLSLSGGNSLGYLYGSFPALADGVHLAYNHYYNAAGSGQVFNTGGATSRLTVGYGFVGLYIGGVNAAPTTQRLLANSTGVTVNGTFNNSSDRNAKQDFAPVNPRQILDQVARLPISHWRYKEDPGTRHIGPMAQDFHAAFKVGTDDKHIAPLDEAGVALVAIQGLNQKLEQRLEQKEAEITELKARMAELERLFNHELNGAVR